MLEINIDWYNEMLRYEPAMDELRALAAWIVKTKTEFSIPALPGHPKEYVFSLIKYYSRKFAEDVDEYAQVLPETVNLLGSGLYSIKPLLGITQDDLRSAKEAQLFANSGFWEMRRCLGQFPDIAERVRDDGISHIISAGISGCVISEYLGIQLEKLGVEIPVDHMVFLRDGALPVSGVLPKGFSFNGLHPLLVDDAVLEARTLSVMLDSLAKKNSRLLFSVFAVDYAEDATVQSFMTRFRHVYKFEE